MISKLNAVPRAQLLVALIITIGVLVASLASVQAYSAQEEARTAAAEATETQKAKDALAESQADDLAETTLDQASQVIDQVDEKVDVTPLVAQVTSLSAYENLNHSAVIELAGSTQTAVVQAQAAAQAADEVAAQAAAAAAAAAAEALRIANTPEGAKATARSLAASRYGWGESQFSCLSQLWQKESGWSYTASNASSGAAGIPQALPGSKMASAGNDWATNAATQISWGLDYIKRAYGTPCSAWSHSQSMNWY